MAKSKISKFQKFEAVTINRNSLVNAPYNPRTIGEKAQKALRKSLKTHGLVETLIYNKRTGNLVGGHQRLSQLDVLEGTHDYELTVAQIDVTEKQEKELNIALNNPNLQGEYDFEILKDLFKDIDVENTGFTDYDLSIIGVEQDLEEVEKKQKSKDEIAEDIQKVKDAKQKAKDKNVSQGENYIVVTFSSIEAKESFLDFIGFETDDRYIKGEILAKKLGQVKHNDNLD
jgi:hypothetical protein